MSLRSLAAIAAGLAFGLFALGESNAQVGPGGGRGERVGAIRKPGGRILRVPLHAAPPAVKPPEPEEHQEGPPDVDDGTRVAHHQTVETRADAEVPQVPGTTTILRNSLLSPPSGFSSSVNEPGVGSQGRGLFMTFNWYTAISTNNGLSFSYTSPYSAFPNSPAPFAAGFCCDQRVAQDPSRDLVFWYLQYVKTGNTATDTNGVRIAVAHGQADLATGTWQVHDFTPADFGFGTGEWFDFPHMQVSSNYLYFTSNVFTAAGDSFAGAVIGRIPLDALRDNTAFTMNTFVTAAFGSIAPVSGATGTMYFAARTGSTSMVVLSWPEGSTSPSQTTVSGLGTTSVSTYICPGPDGLDPCTRANSRLQTGWVTPTELGFMWTSSQDGGLHPFPYVRTVIFDPQTLALISQPDIFSTTNAWLYPAVAVNARGHLGGTIDALGGSLLPTVRALIRDDFSPDVTTSGWETFPVATSTNGASGVWGDYNGAAASEAFPNTWIGVGHVQNGGSTTSFSRPRNFWLMRERDIPVTVAFSVSAQILSEGAGNASVSVVLTTSDGQPTVAAATVNYSTVDGTAKAGSDYGATAGMLTFPAGAASGSSQTFVVPLIDDGLDEGNQSFNVILSSPSATRAIAPTVETVTLTDNDPSPTTTIGLYRPSTHGYYLRNSNTFGPNDVPVVFFGTDGDIPLAGDWDGDGDDTIGLYRPSQNAFYLKNSNTQGGPDIILFFGAPGDIPLVGDWDGDGVDTIGLYRPSTTAFYLRNSNTQGGPDITLFFGASGDIPLVGDWNGDGIDTIGLYRPSQSVFYLRNSNTMGPPDITVTFGAAGDVPVVGDWNADGVDTIGLYRPSQSLYYLRNSNSVGPPDLTIPFGASGDTPLVGNWDGL